MNWKIKWIYYSVSFGFLVWIISIIPTILSGGRIFSNLSNINNIVQLILWSVGEVTLIGLLVFIVGAFKEKNKELYEQKKIVDFVLEAKSDFLTTMSHELRNPLMIITGIINSAYEEDISLEGGHLQILKRTSDNLLSLINDVLNFSKIEAGKMILTMRKFNLKNSITSLIEDYLPSTRSKDLKFDIEMNANINRIVIGDPRILRQILANLISNAIKFTNQGSVGISVEIIEYKSGSDSNSDIIQFCIWDSGIGIRKEDQTIIFDSFKQLKQSDGSLYQGSGLGLAIAKQLVERNNGKIWVESTLKIGSKFFFIIEFKRSMNEIQINPIQSVDPIKFDSRQLNILIVDDSEDNREIMKFFFKKTNYTLDEAENGLVATQKYKSSNFDIVLIDMKMPIMDGWTAIREIRQWEEQNGIKRTPIIVTSAYGQESDITRANEAGCDKYLIKPIKKEFLLKTILDATK